MKVASAAGGLAVAGYAASNLAASDISEAISDISGSDPDPDPNPDPDPLTYCVNRPLKELFDQVDASAVSSCVSSCVSTVTSNCCS